MVDSTFWISYCTCSFIIVIFEKEIEKRLIEMKRIRKILKGRITRILTLMLLDIIVLTLSSFLAIALRFDFVNIPGLYIDNIYQCLIFDIIILIAVNIFYRIYLSIWSYASIIELISIGFACTTYILTEYIYKTLFKIAMPNSYYLIKLILLIIFISAIRYAYRIARTISKLLTNTKDTKKTMIILNGIISIR